LTANSLLKGFNRDTERHPENLNVRNPLDDDYSYLGGNLLNFLKRVFGIAVVDPRKVDTNLNPRSVDAKMNQGDYHSGPAGYSPNTPYPETQYGSGFDEDAEWNEGDWR
jgi:hypothetical protein